MSGIAVDVQHRYVQDCYLLASGAPLSRALSPMGCGSLVAAAVLLQDFPIRSFGLQSSLGFRATRARGIPCLTMAARKL